MVIGPDVSFYEDDNETPQQIDFNKMKSAGAEFVIVRVGQNIWPDSDFAYNWNKSKEAGLLRGCYWFYDSRVAPEKQANLFMKTLGGDLGELPIFADLEERYGGDYAGPENWTTFIERIKQLVPGKEIGVYTAYWYWYDNCPALKRPYFAQYPLWVANYGVSSPSIPPGWSDWLFWQYTDAGDGLKYGTESKGVDLNYFNGDSKTLHDMFGGDPISEAYIIKRPFAKYGYYVTPGSGEMPLLSAIEAAQQNGWECTMNGGAGFDYTDATHAIPKTTGFQYINDINGLQLYYARKMITNNVVASNLDTTYKAPWCVLGFTKDDVYLIVTRGLEGSDGMTQMEAAEYVKSLGIPEAYLMDSGHSAQIEENGTMLYWPYGPNEKVPQHIGLKLFNQGEAKMKGTALANVNVKAMDTSGYLYVMPQGSVVYGDYSPSKTDLINIERVYNSSGNVIQELSTPCKVSIGNWISIVDESEPTEPSPPVEGDLAYTHTITTELDGYEPDTQTISGTLKKL